MCGHAGVCFCVCSCGDSALRCRSYVGALHLPECYGKAKLGV